MSGDSNQNFANVKGFDPTTEVIIFEGNLSDSLAARKQDALRTILNTLDSNMGVPCAKCGHVSDDIRRQRVREAILDEVNGFHRFCSSILATVLSACRDKQSSRVPGDETG